LESVDKSKKDWSDAVMPGYFAKTNKQI